MHSSQTVEKGAFPPLGPLCEGAPPAGGGGENCTAVRNISGYGKALSLRPFGAPPPLAQAPPPPYRGSLSRRGRLFDTLRGMPNALLYFAFCGFYGGLGVRVGVPPGHPSPAAHKKIRPRIERGPKLCYTTIMVCPAKGRIGL